MNQFDELVLNASHVLQIVLLTCAQFMSTGQATKHQCPHWSLLYQIWCKSLVAATHHVHSTPERNYSHVRSVVNASHSLQVVARHIRTVHSTGQATLHQVPSLSLFYQI